MSKESRKAKFDWADKVFAEYPVFLVLIILVAWIVPPLVVWAGSPSIDKAGQFGDAFGVSNALLSALALLGVIASLIAQRRDSSQQLAEMQRARTHDARPFLALNPGDRPIDLQQRFRMAHPRNRANIDDFVVVTCRFALSNATDNPAIRLKVGWSLTVEGAVFDSDSSYYSMAIQSTARALDFVAAMTPNEYRLFQQGLSKAAVNIEFVLRYQNIFKVDFSSSQRFRLEGREKMDRERIDQLVKALEDGSDSPDSNEPRIQLIAIEDYRGFDFSLTDPNSNEA